MEDGGWKSTEEHGGARRKRMDGGGIDAALGRLSVSLF